MPKAPRKKPANRKKQAVLVIHGIGEQVPMDTLRGLVESLWSKDSALHARQGSDPGAGNPVWSKPDFQSGSYELRRLTTRAIDSDGAKGTGPGRRTDFFEYYWADQMQGTTFRHVWDWLRTLLFRRFADVPRDVRFAWCVLWIVFLLILAGAALLAMPKYEWMANIPGLAWLRAWIYGLEFRGVITGGAILALLAAGVRWTIRSGPMISHIGDVARYVRAQPWNIAKRNAIRTQGVALLRKLNEADKYDRIIVVGHSLGSIIGYDLISYLWAEHSSRLKAAPGSNALKALREVEKAGLALGKNSGKGALAKYRARQREYFKTVQSQWKISDFVTLGSPLTHADFLLARTEAKFDELTARREYPTCPPVYEKDAKQYGISGLDKVFSYRLSWSSAKEPWLPHHAAVFAPVRWTNLYDKHALVIFGDIISGPVAGHFGKGVIDVDIKKRRRLFTHTSYWTWKSEYEDEHKLEDHIKVLRDAINLRDAGDPAMKWVKDTKTR